VDGIPPTADLGEMCDESALKSLEIFSWRQDSPESIAALRNSELGVALVLSPTMQKECELLCTATQVVSGSGQAIHFDKGARRRHRHESCEGKNSVGSVSIFSYRENYDTSATWSFHR